MYVHNDYCAHDQREDDDQRRLRRRRRRRRQQKKRFRAVLPECVSHLKGHSDRS